jgi:hypothetical protein
MDVERIKLEILLTKMGLTNNPNSEILKTRINHLRKMLKNVHLYG